MQRIDESQLLEGLNWRYAVKVFDAQRRIPAATWASLERSLLLSPSSYGLQPYRFLVVTDPAVRERLLPHAWGQRQVVDASHLVVMAARTEVTEEQVEGLLARIVEVRNVSAESLKGYRDVMVGDLVHGPRRTLAAHWAARQTYLALGNLLTSAALLGIDACPMEGFMPGKFDEVLGLVDTEFCSVVLCALGYRSPEDAYARQPKVRFSAETLIQRIEAA